MQAKAMHNLTGAARRRRWIRALVAGQPLLLAVAWLAALLLSAVALATLINVFANLSRGSTPVDPRTPVPEASPTGTHEAPPVQALDTTLRPSSADLGTSATDGNAIPTTDWQEEAKVRKAAGLLMRHGDHDAAIALLKQSETGQGLALAVGAAVCEQARGDLSRAVAQEMQQLKTFWEQLPEPEKAMYVRPGQESTRAAFESTVAATPEALELQDAAQHMPQSLLFCFVGNVRDALDQRAASPPALSQLLIETALPSDGLAARLLRTADATERHPYAEAQRLLDRRVTKQLLMPLVRESFSRTKSACTAASTPIREWLKTGLGAAFYYELLQLSPDQAAEFELRMVWRLLANEIRGVWGRHLLLRLTEDEQLRLPRQLVEKNYWLRTAASEFDLALVRLVRAHPDWHKQLRLFSYRAAMDLVPRIAEQLNADTYLAELQQAVRTPLTDERHGLLSVDFSWPALRRHLNVAELRPAALRGALAADQPQGRTGTESADRKADTWDAVTPERFYAGLVYLSKTAWSAEQRALYQRVAQLYSLNRGMEQ